MASYFPFITSDELSEVTEEIPEYKEMAWDFKNDKLILINGKPKIVERDEAIKVWIYKTIKTARYKYPIYTWDYGCEIENIIGKGLPTSLLKSEISRYIEEALLINPYILAVQDMIINFNDGILNIKCIIKTVYGGVKIEI